MASVYQYRQEEDTEFLQQQQALDREATRSPATVGVSDMCNSSCMSPPRPFLVCLPVVWCACLHTLHAYMLNVLSQCPPAPLPCPPAYSSLHVPPFIPIRPLIPVSPTPVFPCRSLLLHILHVSSI